MERHLAELEQQEKVLTEKREPCRGASAGEDCPVAASVHEEDGEERGESTQKNHPSGFGGALVNGLLILGGYLLVDGMTAFFQEDMDVLKRDVAILGVWLVVMGFVQFFVGEPSADASFTVVEREVEAEAGEEEDGDKDAEEDEKKDDVETNDEEEEFYKVPMQWICAAAASAAPCGFMILGGYLLVDGITALFQADMDVLKRDVVFLGVWLMAMGFMKFLDSSEEEEGTAAGRSTTRWAGLRAEGARVAEVRGLSAARAGAEPELGQQPRSNGGLERGRSSSWRGSPLPLGPLGGSLLLALCLGGGGLFFSFFLLVLLAPGVA